MPRAPRGVRAELSAVVATAYGSVGDAERVVHENPTDRAALARLLPAVAVASAGGDAEAGRILAEAAEPPELGALRLLEPELNVDIG